jgi:hypothetical protein
MKIIRATVVLVFALFFVSSKSGAKQQTQELFGYLKNIEKTPPIIRMLVDSKERIFHWSPGTTLFLDDNGQEIEGLIFLRKYKHSTISVFLEDNKVTQVARTFF